MDMFSSRRYHRLAQHDASEGEEEVTLYELTPSGARKEGEFGHGEYIRDRELDLPRIRVHRRAPKHRPSTRLNLVMGTCLCAAIMCVLMTVAVAIILYGVNYHPLQHRPEVASSTAASFPDSHTQTDCPKPIPPTEPTPLPPSHAHSSSETVTSTEASSLPSETHPSTTELHPSTTELHPSTTEPHPPTEPPPTSEGSGSTQGQSEASSSSSSSQPPTQEMPSSSSSTAPPAVVMTTATPPGSNKSVINEVSSSGGGSASTSVHSHTATELDLHPTTMAEPSPPSLHVHHRNESSSSTSETPSVSASPETPAIPPSPSPPPVFEAPSIPPSPETPSISSSPSPPSSPPSPSPGISWERAFLPALTEGSVQLYDMNRDGTLDVLVVDGFSQCTVTIVALDGKTGDTVWQRNVSFEAFAVKCELDMNRDGVLDCLAAGRFAGFIALSGVDGETLWTVDPSLTYPHYNSYFPLITEDLDKDGVQDLMNIHGGDQTYADAEAERSPAFLVVVSGRTGQKLMERIPMPDGRESYMSPVIHTFADGLDVVIFGTGGETLPGALWAVSMETIRSKIQEYTSSSDEYVKYETVTNYTNHICARDISNDDLEAIRPRFDLSDYTEGTSPTPCPELAGAGTVGNSLGLCVYRLVESRDEGIMLPPVMVDITGDGLKDLVVSTFDGHTLLLDGGNATVVWDVFKPGTQTYSIPAPLYYTTDATPDLLVRVNKGHWMDYDYSYMAVLNGRDGSELWTLNSTHTGMMSGLSLRARGYGNDAVVFLAIGQKPDTPALQQDSFAEALRQFIKNNGDGQKPSDADTEQQQIHNAGDQQQQLEDARDGQEGPEVSDLQQQQQERSRKSVSVVELDLPWALSEAGTCRAFFEDPGRREEEDGGRLGEGDERERRHGAGGDGDEEENEEEEEEGRVDEGDYIESMLSLRDPPQTWDQTVDGPFPDPAVDPQGFLAYCGHRSNQLAVYLYLLTRDVIEEGGEPLPLARHDPFIYRNGTAHMIDDRHADPNINLDVAMQGSWKEYRCGHIATPTLLPSTPAIGDLDGDGHLEVAYVILWSSERGPPRMTVNVFSLNDRFDEVYGTGTLDFSRFLPVDQQPWLRYMGSRGDNVYTLERESDHEEPESDHKEKEPDHEEQESDYEEQEPDHE